MKSSMSVGFLVLQRPPRGTNMRRFYSGHPLHTELVLNTRESEAFLECIL